MSGNPTNLLEVYIVGSGDRSARLTTQEVRQDDIHSYILQVSVVHHDLRGRGQFHWGKKMYVYDSCFSGTPISSSMLQVQVSLVYKSIVQPCGPNERLRLF